MFSCWVLFSIIFFYFTYYIKENYNAGKNEEEKEDTLSLHPHSRMQGRQRSVIDLSSQTKQLCQKGKASLFK